MKYNELEVWSLIRNRRSIKPARFSGKPVSDEKIKKMIEAAHWAPCHGLTEPWKFVVYSGDARRRIGQFNAESYKNSISAEEFKQERYDSLIKVCMDCSHVIVVLMVRGDNPKMPEMEDLLAVGCAAQNLHLMATALGVSGYWSTGAATYKESSKEFFKLGPNDKMLGYFYLGDFDGEWPKGRRKANYEDKIQWVKD